MVEQFLTVDQQALESVRALQAERDRRALALGVALLDLLKGALGLLEYERQTRAAQTAIGTEAMRKVGVNPDDGEYTIDLTSGVIERLQAVHGKPAEYVPVKVEKKPKR